MSNSNSNMGVVTIGDIEEQRLNPNWFVKHKHMLRPNQEEGTNKLGYFILKLPQHFRQPPTAFSPVGWQFGLHNRENLDSNGSEVVKLGIAVLFGLVGEKWDHFCDAIVDDPKAMLACYGLHNEVTNWTDEQIKHVLALDALFLASFIDMYFPEDERRLWTRITPLPSANYYDRYNLWLALAPIDLHRVENQIPFVLIDKVVEYFSNFVASQISEGNELRIGDLQYQQRSLEFLYEVVAGCFMSTSGHEAFKIDNSFILDQKTDILGTTYKAICGSKGLLMNQSMERNEYIHVKSATKLEQSGIKIIGVDGPLYTMAYKMKCLCLPKMIVDDSTTSFIRNMSWYEERSISDGCLFNDYISLMTDLIQTREDLDLLVNCHVMDNRCGIKALEMWKALDEGIPLVPSSQTHNDMKTAIVRRCNFRRYRLWSEFKIIFCSRPWLVLSTIAVVLVTMATLVQTYVAIIGSNKMKPKFL